MQALQLSYLFLEHLCHRPAALFGFFFLEKGVQKLHIFSLKLCFHTKLSSTDKQNTEINYNGIKLHWWKFKLLCKWNAYELDVFIYQKDALICQKQAWKFMPVVWLMMLQLIQCNWQVLLKWKGLLGFLFPFSCFGSLLCWYHFTCQDRMVR